MKRKFHGTIHKGRLVLDDKDGFKLHIDTLGNNKDKTQRVTVTLCKFRKARSTNQNSYYHGVIVRMLADELGYTDEEMHEAIKWQFLQKKGAKIPTVRSTSDLSTVEFEDLMSRIRTWASSELKVYLPAPNEVDFKLW